MHGSVTARILGEERGEVKAADDVTLADKLAFCSCEEVAVGKIEHEWAVIGFCTTRPACRRGPGTQAKLYSSDWVAEWKLPRARGWKRFHEGQAPLPCLHITSEAGPHRAFSAITLGTGRYMYYSLAAQYTADNLAKAQK